jgi:hypothetical protein
MNKLLGIAALCMGLSVMPSQAGLLESVKSGVLERMGCASDRCKDMFDIEKPAPSTDIPAITLLGLGNSNFKARGALLDKARRSMFSIPRRGYEKVQGSYSSSGVRDIEAALGKGRPNGNYQLINDAVEIYNEGVKSMGRYSTAWYGFKESYPAWASSVAGMKVTGVLPVNELLEIRQGLYDEAHTKYIEEPVSSIKKPAPKINIKTEVGKKDSSGIYIPTFVEKVRRAISNGRYRGYGEIEGKYEDNGVGRVMESLSGNGYQTLNSELIRQYSDIKKGDPMWHPFKRPYLVWASRVAGKKITKGLPISELLEIRKEVHKKARKKYLEDKARKETLEKKRVAKAKAEEAERQKQASIEYKKRYQEQLKASRKHIAFLEKATGKKSMFTGSGTAISFVEAVVDRSVNNDDIGKFISIYTGDNSYYVSQVTDNGAVLEPRNSYDRDMPIMVVTQDAVFVGDVISDLGQAFMYNGLIKYTTVLGSKRQAILLVKLK